MDYLEMISAFPYVVFQSREFGFFNDEKNRGAGIIGIFRYLRKAEISRIVIGVEMFDSFGSDERSIIIIFGNLIKQLARGFAFF
jgi:hypothetical protein